MNKYRLVLEFPLEWEGPLKARAAESGKTMAEFVRAAVQRSIGGKRLPRMRRRGEKIKLVVNTSGRIT